MPIHNAFCSGVQRDMSSDIKMPSLIAVSFTGFTPLSNIIIVKAGGRHYTNHAEFYRDPAIFFDIAGGNNYILQ